jgi:hypothetical protein
VAEAARDYLGVRHDGLGADPSAEEVSDGGVETMPPCAGPRTRRAGSDEHSPKGSGAHPASVIPSWSRVLDAQIRRR